MMRNGLDEHRRRLLQDGALRGRSAEIAPTRSVGRARHDRAQSNMLDALAAEHQAVCGLLARCNAAAQQQDEDPGETTRLADRLAALMRLEEDVLHPALTQDASFAAEIEAAQVEHGVLRQLLAQLEASEPRSVRRRATLHVLARLMRQHMEDEVYQLFPRLRRAEVDLDGSAERVATALARPRGTIETRLHA